MLKVAKSICDIYPLLNRSLLYSAIILHDLGKVKELSGPVATTYTVEGNLLGIFLLQAMKWLKLQKNLALMVKRSCY